MIFLSELAENIQTPGIPLPDQAKNGREIVGENNETKPAAVNRSRGLEDLFFLLNDGFSAVWCVGGDRVGVLPRPAFIDLEEFLSNVLDWVNSESDQK